MDEEKYELADDGLWQEKVGPWVREKHHFLQYYVDATKAVRGHLGGEPSFLDPYCGPGQVRVREERASMPGGTVAALMSSQAANKGQSAPYKRAMIGDLLPENVEQCATRLREIFKGQLQEFPGPAEATVLEMMQHLPRKGLHLAYLDPYSVFVLPFSIIEALSAAGKVDIIMHFASNDVSRNIQRPDLWHKLDLVAPGWRSACDGPIGKGLQRQRFFEYWKSLFKRVGYYVSERPVPMTNTRDQEMYRLVLASKNELGPKIWDTLNSRSKQKEFW